MDLTVTNEVRPGATVVCVAGELDMFTSGDLTQHFDALALGEHAVLILDLSGVTFLDSSGLSSLVGLRHTVMNVEGRLGLIVGVRTLKLLRVTNMDGVFSLYDTVEHAILDLARAG